MMRSMFSGISGLRIHQTKMDVIANNISNVNTVGYKASRVTFNEVFSQTIAGASSANDSLGTGGVNPMQIGLGANISSIDKRMTQGAAQRTDNPFDLMIQGDGFFVVGSEAGNYFTRAGSLALDASGNLVTNTGLKVMGWDTGINNNTLKLEVVKDNVKPIMIVGDKEYSDPRPTKGIAYSGNLNAQTNPTQKNTISFFDSVGNRYVVDTKLVYSAPAADAAAKTTTDWKLHMGNLAYPNGDKTKPMPIKIVDGKVTFEKPDPTKAMVLSYTDETEPPSTVATLTFNNNGKVISAVKGDTAGEIPEGGTGPKEFYLQFNAPEPGPGILTPAAYFGDGKPDYKIRFDFKDVTQFGNESSNCTSEYLDGNEPGNLNGVSISSNGELTGRYSNGQTKILGQIPVAMFKNPAGLEKIGDNLFTTTSNSGQFDGIGIDVKANGGSLMGGVLEMSNVDLAAEFTEMITTQRGFQANSRVITTSDDMLQELVSLKR